MNRQWASIMLPITLFLLVAVSSAQPISYTAPSLVQEERQQPKTKKEAKPGIAAITGCIDEQDGHYVLVDDRTLTAIADLEADGFPTEGFAKFMGHKVTVRGTSISGAGRPTVKVRNVEKVSETCAPQHQ